MVGRPLQQVDRMVTLLHEALADGALGFSTSQSQTHNDGSGQPVPSRSASRDELLALATGVRDHPGTTLEAIIPGCLQGFSDDEIALLTDMSVAADRPLNWNLLGVSAANPAGHQRQLRASEVAAERGGRVVALTLPHAMKIRLSFLTGFVLDGLPGWRDTMHLPVPERLAALADPEVRRRLNDGAQSKEAGMLRGLANWARLIIVETFAPQNADRDRPQCRGGRRRSWWGAVRHPARHRDRRRAAHRTDARAVRRRRRRLAACAPRCGARRTPSSAARTPARTST